MTASDIKEIYRRDLDQDSNPVQLLVFPGIGLLPPDQWHCAHHTPWLEMVASKLQDSGHGCVVLAVYHNLSPDSMHDWQGLLERGMEAIKIISQYREDTQTQNSPMVFIGHSLGGVISKTAMIYAHRAAADYERLMASIQGFVFLSVPHLPDKPSEAWNKPVGILKLEFEQPDSVLSTERELRPVVRVSRMFEKMARQVPLLSTWEEKPSKLKGFLNYKSRKTNRCILVDSCTARTYTDGEKAIPVKADHRSICVLEGHSPLGYEITDFIMRCLSFSPEHLKQEQHVPERRASAPQVAQTEPMREETRSISPLATTPSTMASKAEKLQPVDVDRRTRSLPQIPEFKKQRRSPDFPVNYHGDIMRLDDFKERDDILRRIDETLSLQAPDSDCKIRFATLWGSPGIGKSSIASNYLAVKESALSPDAVFWVHADTVQKMLDDFENIAVMLHLANRTTVKDQYYIRKLVLDWLEEPAKSFHPVLGREQPRVRWLLVFDNVDEASDLVPFLPKTGSGTVIITTRVEQVKWIQLASGYVDTGVEIGTFSRDEGANFLRKLAPGAYRPGDDSDLLELVDRLDRLPIALRQMGRHVHANNLTFRDFLEIYREESSHIKLYGNEAKLVSAQYPFSMATVWAFERLSKRARALLNVISLVDPDCLTGSFLHPESLQHTEHLCPYSRTQHLLARNELQSRSLITVSSDGTALSLHRTVQDVARAQMTQEEYEASFSIAVNLLREGWPVKGRDRFWHYPVDHWADCKVLLPSVVQLHLHYQARSTSSAAVEPTNDFVFMLLCAGWYCHERGDPYQAEAFFKTAEKSCPKIGKDKEETQKLLVEVWKCLGCVATETNNGEACVSYYEKFLEEVQKEFDDPDTSKDYDQLSIAYNEMAVGYMMMGKVKEALDFLEVAEHHANRRRKASDTAASAYMLASANLGLAHWLQDHLEDSVNILSSAFAFHKSRPASGDQDFAPGRLMHALGNVRTTQGLRDDELELETGFNWHCQAHRHYLSTIHEGHHRTADVAHRVAEHHMRRQELQEAEKHLLAARTVFASKRCYKPELMRTTHLLGDLRRKQGKAEEGNVLVREATKMYRDLRLERKEGVPTRHLQQSDFDASITFWSR